MDHQFVERYAPTGREVSFMGFKVQDMEPDELYAVIGFLLERVGEDAQLDLMQAAPLGAPRSDPPKTDGLIEG